MKQKLLILELWGLGDLLIATPFLRAASEKYDVTLVAKAYAHDLRTRFWPDVRVLTFVAPWTAFKGKYRLWRWPWLEAVRLQRKLAHAQFDAGLSARWDPRDHLLLFLAGARYRIGFPRIGSQLLLTQSLTKPAPREHRYEYWRVIARALEISLPPRENLQSPKGFSPLVGRPHTVLVHSGAGQAVRVWPLERYAALVAHLRKKEFDVIVACDANQRAFWLQTGETGVSTPQTVSELMALTDATGVFIGNDSGPGHLAALSGVPTFTIFGPQLPEWFLPLHPAADWSEGKACPYRPCSDYCRFSAPRCLTGLGVEEIRIRVDDFLARYF